MIVGVRVLPGPPMIGEVCSPYWVTVLIVLDGLSVVGSWLALAFACSQLVVWRTFSFWVRLKVPVGARIAAYRIICGAISRRRVAHPGEGIVAAVRLQVLNEFVPWAKLLVQMFIGKLATGLGHSFIEVAIFCPSSLSIFLGLVLFLMTVGVAGCDGIVFDVGVEVEGLGIAEAGVGDGGGFGGPVGGHEAGEGGGVEASAEVIEVGGAEGVAAIAFFGGEMHGAIIAAGLAAVHLVAEGTVDTLPVHTSVCLGAIVLGAQPIRVHEGDEETVVDEVATRRVELFAHAPAWALLGDNMVGKVKNVVDLWRSTARAGAGGSDDGGSPAFGIVDVSRAEVRDGSNSALGVVGVGVGAVVGQVAGRIVSRAGTSDAIISVKGKAALRLNRR